MPVKPNRPVTPTPQQTVARWPSGKQQPPTTPLAGSKHAPDSGGQFQP
jgi:hypothetical protein